MMTLQLRSPAFPRGQGIPPKYTADGQNVSPPLQWEDVPRTARSLVLIVDDPDVSDKTRVHWVLFNLPPETTSLPENLSKQPVLPTGSQQGLNDFQQIGYSGPAPAQKTHRYYFKLYALDRPLDLPEGTTKADIEARMMPSILAVGALIGKYPATSIPGAKV